MKTTITIILLIIFNFCYAQTNKNDWALRISAGANEQPYFEKIWGHYLKAGVKYFVYNNLSLLFSHEMSESDNYPDDFVILFNNSIWGGKEFVERFKGISRDDWRNGKTNFTSNSNSIYILQAGYDFFLGKKKEFLITPKLGYSFVKTKSFVTTLQEVAFVDNELVDGNVKYDNKILKLWGFHYGIEFAKPIGQKSKIFIEINKTADKTGEQIYEFFEAFTVGVGYEIKINSSKK